MTLEELARRHLTPTLGVEEVAELYGVSPWTVRRRVADGTFPVAPRRLGRLLRWPTASVLRDLDLGNGEDRPTQAGPSHTNIATADDIAQIT